MNRHLEHYNRRLIPNARMLRRQMTDAERKLWRHVRNNQLGPKIRRQVPIGRYVLDFYCQKAKLCIEVDGSQHFEAEGLRRDGTRDSYLELIGIEVLRISNYDALTNTQGVLQRIYEMIHERLKEETPS